MRQILLCLILGLSALDARAGEAVTVTTRPLSDLLVYPRHEAPASVISLNPSLLAAEVTARIIAMPVEAGETVAKDAVLVELDRTDHELALQQAEAALAAARARAAQAESQLKRAREVFDKGRYVSEDTLAQREMEARVAAAGVQQAMAALAVARRQLDKCVVRAPFAAAVRIRHGHLGELAMPGTPLLEIVDLDRVQVSAAVQADAAASLGEDTEVTLLTANGRHALRLLRVSPLIDRAARTREVRLRFADAPADVGSEGRVVWQGTRPLLPPEWLSRRDGGLGVFIREGDRARWVALPGAEEGRPAPIDLPAATPVIDRGRFEMQDGQPVTVD